MTIKNPWSGDDYNTDQFVKVLPVCEVGEFKVFKMFEKSYLYVYRDFAFSCLSYMSQHLIQCHYEQKKPENKNLLWLYNRGKETIDKMSK